MELQKSNLSFISLAFGLSLVFTAVQFGNSACSSSLEEEKRVDCHPGPDATMDKCRCKGCQWCTATKSGVPYCFHNSDSTVLSQVSLRVECKSCAFCKERIDCHPDAGAMEARCLARSCLWCANGAPGEPWCFYGGTDLVQSYRAGCLECDKCTKAIDCLPGDSSPTDTKCKSKGCLWCVSGTPKCRIGGTLTAPVNYRANCPACSTCTMKYDCHPEPGATEAKCTAKECIWCVSTVAGEPWCLYGGSKVAVCTTCDICNTRIDCHPESFASKWSCEYRGCLWCPTKLAGIPFCVYPS